MPDKNSIIPAGAEPHATFDHRVFIFRSLQVTEAVAFGEGARACVSLFGEVFQRDKNKASGMRRICSGRVEFDAAERDGSPVGRFSFPADVEVQPFFLAYVDVRPSAMQGLMETLRSGPGVELAFRADIEQCLSDIAAEELGMPVKKRGSLYSLRTVSVSVSR
ncbi:MAG: hypothetical protein CME88_01340 [Hirschia sp.]|nr:hypothetical protein [Hirschia sp.]MBF17005.1 hypothetical protein [Hirschia sp.]